MLCAALLLALPSLLSAAITLENSQLFDATDVSTTITRLDMCSNGCFVYAAVYANSPLHDNIAIATTDAVGITTTIKTLTQLAFAYKSGNERDFLKLDPPEKGKTYVVLNTIDNLKAAPLAIYTVSSIIKGNVVTIPRLVYDIPSFDYPNPGYEISVNGTSSSFSILSVAPFTLTGIHMDPTTYVDAYMAGYAVFYIQGMKPVCKSVSLSLPYTNQPIRIPSISPLLSMFWPDAANFTIGIRRGIEDSIYLESGDETLVTSPGYMGCEGQSNFRVDASVMSPTNVRTQFTASNILSLSFDADVREESADDSIFVRAYVDGKDNGNLPIRFNTPYGKLEGNKFRLEWSSTKGIVYRSQMKTELIVRYDSEEATRELLRGKQRVIYLFRRR